MADITVPGLADRVATELPKFFRDGVDQIRMGEGEYLRSGEPQGVVGKIGQAIGRSYCRRYGADPSAARFGNAVRIENACRPYLDDESAGNGVELSTDLQGGQCAGVLYSVTQTMTATSPYTGAVYTRSMSVNVTGPITEIRQDTGSTRQICTVSGGGAGARSVSNISFRLIVFAAGDGGLLDVVVAGSPWGPSTCTAQIVLPGDVLVVTNRVIARADGLPDVCGNPPPTVRQPRSQPDTRGPSFRFNPSADIDLGIEVDVLPDGTVNFDIGTGPINVDLFPTEGGGDGSGGGDGPPGDVGEADNDAAEDADENGDAAGCGGDNQVLGGLKIEVVTVPDSAREYSPGIYRGAAYIYMGVEGNLDQDFGGSMLKSGQFFLPEKTNLTCWQVRANFGYKLRVTPYYKTLEE